METNTVLDRIIQYQPEECVSLDAIEDKDTLRSELEKIFNFLREHELRVGDKNCSHINYGGVNRTWYSTLSGRYKFDSDSLPTLNAAIVKMARLGVPLQLVECRENKLDLFPLYFDIDIKLSTDENGNRKFDPFTIEKEIIDEENGFRFFKFFLKILNLAFNQINNVVVYSATGTNRAQTANADVNNPVLMSDLPSKVSFRLVFPSIVVDRDRSHRVWMHVVEKLQNLGKPDSHTPYIRDLQVRLKDLSPANIFEKVIDESVLKCRNGVRMIFNDKIERQKTTGRIFKPLFVLTPITGGDAKISHLEISRRPTGDEMDDIDWLQMGSLVTPSLSHAVLSEWNQPSVRKTSRVIRTGPGGSSLALSNLTTADAARAAARAAGTTRRRGWYSNSNGFSYQDPISQKYNWNDGSINEFKKRMPMGIEAQIEQTKDGIVTWRVTNRRNYWIRFSETNKMIELTAPDSDTLRQVTGIVEKFPGIVPVTTLPAPTVAPPEPTRRERVFRVIQNFKGEEEGELSVDAGEVVVLIQEDSTGWTGVRRVKDGQQGFVPRVYLDEL
jgi:hypothetical protein